MTEDRPRWPTDRDSLERAVKVDFYRAGGPGGQHRNKTESAVRLTHLASGGRASASERRSREQNRELAFERLAAKLRVLNHRPKKRVASKPTKASKRRNAESKQRRSAIKRSRRGED
ncbi:MAG: peptide chain release factor-like protein [Planctomycetota bacterium]|nr:peptide chain release factor-like protein [Planctomycetota bacterium]